NVFTTLDGGGHWVNLAQAAGFNLDGTFVEKIVTNPNAGSHEAYVVTQRNVYHVTFNVTYSNNAPPVISNVVWKTVTGNLFALKHTIFGSTNPSQDQVESILAPDGLTSLAVDWRGSSPVLYVGGIGGVFRSKDGGTTWKLFPNVSEDGASTDGGRLPV